ncbi:3-deoxy-8-phosphooctulonate synthase [Parachlamydia sp. AcF125]|uniref:3-deoxy-8-phosphooctulonate synthase n=1 Tax=Parachlamydia sp. AcF125 TaxID=2795736 RepID=UPI001BC9248B|nr:3-deoxy-8-phosphooctulonate synthase [Parachlamydia sp. AcF125]MBS4169250.1 2-dehydro-3-deoxyphosphooctonate aldolase [Parachlamydia sp. AcF125]
MKKTTPKLAVKDFYIGQKHLVIMSGPCVIESEAHTLKAAEALQKIFMPFKNVRLIFKSSYDKANRTSVHSFRGPGLEEGLRILQKVREQTGLAVVTDVHSPQEAVAASQVCEIIQIPAFLCRQTDLVVAAGKTGAIVNIKKGQFMAPWDMKNVVDKLHSTGNQKVILTDRGASFGYNNLVSDMRAIPIMQQMGVPVCFDATHSVQLPGGQGHASGGQREFIPVLAKAAVAVGVDCLFIESHPDPQQAKSDAASVMHFKDLPKLLKLLEPMYQLVRQDLDE